MTYRWFTTGELIDEVESFSAQISAIALQMEKLTKLRSEGRISDIVYAELYEDICRKIDSSRGDKRDLEETAKVRIKEIGLEVNELKYRLERLEVRHMLDFVSGEKYSAAKDELAKKMAEDNEIMLLMSKLLSSIGEAFNYIDSCMKPNHRQTIQVQTNAAQPDKAAEDAITMTSKEPEPHVDEVAQTQTVQVQTNAAQPDKAAEDAKTPTPNPIEPQSHLAAIELINGEVECPECHRGNPREANFCYGCGLRLIYDKPINNFGSNSNSQTITVFDNGNNEVKAEGNAPVIHGERKKKNKHVIDKIPDDFTVKKCPKCGLENLSIASYCYHCNTSLASDEKTTSFKPWLGRP